jgi:hypothetical protein
MLPEWLGSLTELTDLWLGHRNKFVENSFGQIPVHLRQLKKLQILGVSNCQLTELPDWLGEMASLQHVCCDDNHLTRLPKSLAQLRALTMLTLDDNPLNPALQSAYDAGLGELMAYLRSLDDAEPLYEAKLVLVGEGGVGKTTLLKALMARNGKEPREGELTTHGVQIDIQALQLPHPEEEGVEVQLNAWDFGGQEVYRVTHQFFFSPRSLYLLVWEPRAGVQQCQVEDWLNMIRLRVGDDAPVLIVSTHCKTGGRIARIDKPVFMRDFGSMVVGFHEVDSLVDDAATGEKVGIAELKEMIAEQAAQLEQMGMELGRSWREARDELLALPEPLIPYGRFSEVCRANGLSTVATKALAHLMHDLGYVVYYADDERLRDDVVLQPEWLTKAISFVLEDRTSQEMDGILPDGRLPEVWRDHSFENEPRYDPSLYPFFLRLMEKHDVSYRLPNGTASLVAQHVPQVRPDLPWLPEQKPPDDLRRIAMICAMDEEPPGLVPWMIVRTHDYATERSCADGHVHRLHWQKGMFLCHPPHGDAVLEKRGREFHVYTQAIWPEYFMNVLQHTLQKLITDNWPGLEGRYRFAVPCPARSNGERCPGRFNIDALRQFLAEGDRTIRCQQCRNRQSIAQLLFGFEERSVDEQLREIKEQLAGLDSRIANYFMAMMRAVADEAKHGPRLFTLRVADGGLSPKLLVSQPFELQLWCEAEGCQHPVFEKGKGVYRFDAPREWVAKVVPYAEFVLGVLKTVAPAAGPAINVFFGPKTTETWGIKDHLDLAKSLVGRLPSELEPADRSSVRRDMLEEAERSGILALHSMLRELDPNQERLGLHRVPTYTGDYRWLCKDHYEAWQPRIPDKIEG